jgi:hypothetical protein
MGNVTGMAAGGLPEDYGIGALPARNIERMADGGIAGYDDQEGMAAGGSMFDFAQRSEPVLRMAGGGVPGYKKGGLTEKQEFAMQYKDLAEKVGAELGVDPGIIIAQWGMETGWGKKTVGQYNFGNIKDVTGKGPKAYDKKEKSRDSYKSYESPDEFAADYSALIKRNFPNAIGAGADIKAFSAGLQSGRKGAYATDPNYEKVLANTFKNLPVGTAVAEEAPKVATAKSQPTAEEKSDKLGPNAAALSATTGLGALMAKAPMYLDKFAPSLVNDPKGLAQAMRNATTAGGVTAAVPVVGGLLSTGAANALSNATPEQLEQMEGYGADPSGTSFGAAIMNPKNRAPENASKMSSGEQISNALAFVPKLITQHPDINRMREKNKAKEERDAVPKQLGMVPVSPDEFGSAVGIPEPVQEKAVEVAKEAIPEKKGFKLDNEDLVSLGLRLMASKSPNFLAAAGEAGIGALADKKEREKAATEKAYKEAQTKYSTAYADAIERGAKEKNEQFQAETLIQKAMSDWDKNNKIASIQDPTARMREEQRIREQIYASMGIKPIMAQQAAPTSSGGFKFVGVG